MAHAPTLLDHIRGGADRPDVPHHPPRGKLADAPKLYETFRDKKDDCVKVVLTP